MVTDMKDLNIWAYRRENGSLGVRNYVLLLPLDAVSSQICRGVNSLINGTKTFYHPYGRMQFGKDLELHFRSCRYSCGHRAGMDKGNNRRHSKDR